MLSKNKSAKLFWLHFIISWEVFLPLFKFFAKVSVYLSVNLDETSFCQFSIRAILLEALVPVMMRCLCHDEMFKLIINETSGIQLLTRLGSSMWGSKSTRQVEMKMIVLGTSPKKPNNNIFLTAKNGSICFILCKDSGFQEINCTEFLSFSSWLCKIAFGPCFIFSC